MLSNKEIDIAVETYRLRYEYERKMLNLSKRLIAFANFALTSASVRWSIFVSFFFIIILNNIYM